MGMIDHLTGEIAPDLDQQISDRIAKERAARVEFEERIRLEWARPLELLHTLLVLAAEAGNTNVRNLVAVPEEEVGLDEWALVRLHLRTHRTAAEVHALLRCGYADGALARCRTMHELVIVARLIRKYGPPIAHRYFDHFVIQEYRNLQDHQRRAAASGGQFLPREYMRAVKEQYKLVKAQYGPDFQAIAGSTIGWAFGIVPLRGDLRGLEWLEAEVGLSHFRQPYQAGNDAIHAGAMGITRWLSDPTGSMFGLAAATNVGLGDPGQLASIYITMATEALLVEPEGIAADRIGWRHTVHALGTWQRPWFKLMHSTLDSARASFAETDRQVRAQVRHQTHKP